jgi:hypothetical protein
MSVLEIKATKCNEQVYVIEFEYTDILSIEPEIPPQQQNTPV